MAFTAVLGRLFPRVEKNVDVRAVGWRGGLED